MCKRRSLNTSESNLTSMMDKWINKMQYIHIMEYNQLYSVFKRKEILTCYNIDKRFGHYAKRNKSHTK